MLATTLLLALRALRRNALRSALTALGMIIGVAAVIAMVGIGEGARAQIEERVARLGRNVILIYPASITTAGVRVGWGASRTLTPEDAEAIAHEVPHLTGVSPEVRTRAQVTGRGKNWNTLVTGISSDYLFVRDWPLAAGATFTAEEVTRLGKVAIVGQTVVEQLGFNSPLGQIIRIHGAPFKIVGVLAKRGFTADGRDEDDLVMVPYTSYLSRVDRGDRLNSILLGATDPATFAQITRDVTALLRQRHNLAEDALPDFIVRTQEEITATATATTDTMTTLLGAIAGVSLLVGGIGIMNIMLVSVTERTREIGIRMAVGARGSNVLLQFLTEAVILSVGGGALGVALGVGSSHAIAGANDWPVQVSPPAIVVAVLFSVLIGVFFGYYPARRAARLDPIEALRHE
jgi:putative ABC transport system permease protein